MKQVRRLQGAGALLLALMMVPAPAAWAQMSGAEIVKTLDTDDDGTVDLAECKAAAAAMFDKLDTDKSTTLDQEELGDRGTINIVGSPHRRMFFQTRPSKDDYIGYVVKRFDVVDPDHEGEIDAAEFETEDGQALAKLLQ